MRQHMHSLYLSIMGPFTLTVFIPIIKGSVNRFPAELELNGMDVTFGTCVSSVLRSWSLTDPC